MPDNKCEHFREQHGSCGLLDKDDHTYPCAELCAKNECPVNSESKCWSCKYCGDRSPLYPDFNYCYKKQNNVVGHYGCDDYERKPKIY